MFTSTVSRSNFAEMINTPRAGTALPEQLFYGVSDVHGELTLVWRDIANPGRSLPSAIKMPREEQREFFAWTYTYLPTLRPLTAYIRVVDPALISSIERTSNIGDLGRLTEAFVALVISEALSYLEPKADAKNLTSNACANTHSFALIRALVLGCTSQLSELSEAWFSAGEITKQTRRSMSAAALIAPFQVLSTLHGRRVEVRKIEPGLSQIREACKEIADEGDVSDRTWRDLIRPLGLPADLRGQMRESREQRVRAFDSVSVLLSAIHPSHGALTAFVSGYLASLIAPGELAHFGFISRILPAIPAASLWFGLCAGLRQTGHVLSFSDGLGRRILRDLEQSDDLLNRPRSDIALAELEVLIARERAMTDFRTSASGSLAIELLPCVATTVRWKVGEFQTELFERRDVVRLEIREAFHDLSASLERVLLARGRMARLVGLDSDSISETLEDRKPKRR